VAGVDNTPCSSSKRDAAPNCTALALELRDAAHAVSEGTRRHRLVLLVGEPRSGKTTALRALSDKTGWPLLGLNLPLSERLLELPTRFRVISVLDHVRKIVDASEGDVLIIDNIELLFDHQLHVDPVGLLLELARHRSIIASWPGTHDGTALVYADPTHLEHRRDSRSGYLIVQSRIVSSHVGGHPPEVEP